MLPRTLCPLRVRSQANRARFALLLSARTGCHRIGDVRGETISAGLAVFAVGAELRRAVRIHWGGVFVVVAPGIQRDILREVRSLPINFPGGLGAKRLEALLLSWKVAGVFFVSTEGGLESCKLGMGSGNPGTRGRRTQVDATRTQEQDERGKRETYSKRQHSP